MIRKKAQLNQEKNYGLNLLLEKQQQSEQDWIFGAISPTCIAEIPPLEREVCLPQGEKQNIGSEKMDCATRGPINILETKFTYLIKNKIISEKNIAWLHDKGYITLDGKVEFSDRFVAINSGTTEQGNSLKAPLDAIRTHSDENKNCGLIPKFMFPQIDDFDEYYDASKITDEMRKLGHDFLDRFSINYEKVLESQIPTMLKRDVLDLAGFAWPEPIDGEYPRTDNIPNHCFMGLNLPSTYIFDNYLDRGIAGDYIKKLASDYDFLGYGYRIIIAEKKSGKVGFWEKIINLIKKLWM